MVAQLLHRRGAVALGELLAVRAVQQRHVGVDRRLGAHRLEDPHLLGRVGEVVGAADHVGDAGVEVVDHHGQVVDRRAVGAGDHEVVHQAVLERALAADHVAHDGRALVGHPQPDGALALVLAAEAGVAVGRLEGLDLLGTRGGAVGVTAGDQLLDDLGVAVAALGLEDGVAVPVELEPAQRLEDLLDVLRASSARGRCPRCAARTPRRAPGQEPVVQCRPRSTDVERAGRRRGEAHAHTGHSMPLKKSVQNRC